ncbi:FAD:protein FMN transferase [Bradyrhizobium sp. STM 3809]|uniref:FAD:protein FMN transferase n=1 Tax=Bradyrhizobium sp. STM 3809 TaxID=551936 RepID=UPI000A043AF7|nr:FAD:protein FMN transferase [Bradyrhizobium sp. STM 3809]
MKTVHFQAMGSPCAVHVDGEAALHEQAAKSVIAEVFRIEAKYSRYLPNSLLSKINREASLGRSIRVDEETAELIDYAGACYRLSDQLFDITSGILRKAWDFGSGIPLNLDRINELIGKVGFEKLGWVRPVLTFDRPDMEIDLGGIAKEYAADRGVDICRSLGIESCLIDLGGDISIGGPRRDGEPWLISIRDAKSATQAFATLTLSKGGLGSSGDYERFIEIEGRRYSHILDPRTGWPVSGLSSVSVASDHCLAAGSLSTIAMLKGSQGAEWLLSRGISHAAIDHHGSRFATPPFVLT